MQENVDFILSPIYEKLQNMTREEQIVYLKSYGLQIEDLNALNSYERLMEFEENGVYKAADIIRNTGNSEQTEEKYKRLFKDK